MPATVRRSNERFRQARRRAILLWLIVLFSTTGRPTRSLVRGHRGEPNFRRWFAFRQIRPPANRTLPLAQASKYSLLSEYSIQTFQCKQPTAPIGTVPRRRVAPPPSDCAPIRDSSYL